MYHGQQYLTDSQNGALTVAAHLLTDNCLGDIERLARGDALDEEETVLLDDTVLPPRFRTFYDLAFAERLLAVIMTVAWKIASLEQHELACVAEEMLFSAVVRHATWIHNDVWDLTEAHVADESAPDGTPKRIVLEELVDYGPFEDLDFELLWSDALDGIQDSDVGAMMGMGGTNFREWFEPFVQRGNVHPFAAWPTEIYWMDGAPKLNLDGSP